MRFNKTSLFTIPAALLMLMSGGFGAAASTAQAKRMPTPWKMSWNSAKDTPTLFTSPKILSHQLYEQRSFDGVDKRTNDHPSYDQWNSFFQKHQDPGQLTNFAKTYPGFYRLSQASHNINVLGQGHAWGLSLPNDYTSQYGNEDDINLVRNSDLLANKKLSGFLPKQLNELHRVMIPAQNGHKILDSYNALMKKSNNHPTLMLGNVKYVYSPTKAAFVQASGQDASGATYQFDPTTNQYQQTSTGKLNQQVSKQNAQLQNQINHQVNLHQTQAKFNTAFSNQTRQKLQEASASNAGEKALPKTTAALHAFYNGPEAGYLALANDSELTPAQRGMAKIQAAKYAAATPKSLSASLVGQAKPAMNSNAKVTFPLTPTQKYDVEALFMHGAFSGMPRTQAIGYARYLVKHPAQLNLALSADHIAVQPHITQNAGQLAKAANGKAKQDPKSAALSNQNGVITSNKPLATNLKLKQSLTKQLGQVRGVKKSTAKKATKKPAKKRAKKPARKRAKKSYRRNRKSNKFTTVNDYVKDLQDRKWKQVGTGKDQTVESTSGPHMAFKTFRFLPDKIKDVHSIQSIAVEPDGKYAYLGCDAYPYLSGYMRILKVNMQDPKAPVQVGPRFDGGHGQALSYNPKNNQLWLLNDPSGPVSHGTFEQIDGTSLKPVQKSSFKQPRNDNLGDTLAFDKKGNAYNENRIWKWDVKKPYQNGNMVINKGTVNNKQGKTVMHRVNQGLRRAPGYIIQGLAYDPKNDRLYVETDDSIMSFPASKVGKLAPRDVKDTMFKGHREYEGLSFDKSGRAYLVMSRPKELLKSVNIF